MPSLTTDFSWFARSWRAVKVGVVECGNSSTEGSLDGADDRGFLGHAPVGPYQGDADAGLTPLRAVDTGGRLSGLHAAATVSGAALIQGMPDIGVSRFGVGIGPGENCRGALVAALALGG